VEGDSAGSWAAKPHRISGFFADGHFGYEGRAGENPLVVSLRAVRSPQDWDSGGGACAGGLPNFSQADS
jgi:hypothetical protein